MDREQVLKLAKLARVGISDTEAESLSHEFDGILKYVGEISEAKIEDEEATTVEYLVKNVLREDERPHDSGIHTEALLREAPKTEGQFVMVKKIL